MQKTTDLQTILQALIYSLFEFQTLSLVYTKESHI